MPRTPASWSAGTVQGGRGGPGSASALPHKVFSGLGHFVPAVGALGCAAAVAALSLDLLRAEPATLVTVAIIGTAILLARLAFVAVRRGT